MTRLMILFIVVIGCAWKVNEARTEVHAMLAKKREVRQEIVTSSSMRETRAVNQQPDSTKLSEN